MDTTVPHLDKTKPIFENKNLFRLQCLAGDNLYQSSAAIIRFGPQNCH